MADTKQDLVDLGPSATALAAVVAAIADDDLDRPTPCPAYSVADVVDHVAGLTVAFTAAARKQPQAMSDPSVDGTRLPPGWRERIGADLERLAQAWRDPAAHEGTTMAGPVEMPASEAACVALDEIVVHAWDLSRATGRPYTPDPEAVAAAAAWIARFPAERDGGLFGPVVAVAPDATPLEHLIGLAGRDPNWIRPSA